jgi:hypothetical protein
MAGDHLLTQLVSDIHQGGSRSVFEEVEAFFGGEKLSVEGFGKEFFYHKQSMNKDREEEVGFWMGLQQQFFIPPLKSGGNSNSFFEFRIVLTNGLGLICSIEFPLVSTSGVDTLFYAALVLIF